MVAAEEMDLNRESLVLPDRLSFDMQDENHAVPGGRRRQHKQRVPLLEVSEFQCEKNVSFISTCTTGLIEVASGLRLISTLGISRVPNDRMRSAYSVRERRSHDPR